MAGVLAGSIALVGFGIDSFIEVTSAGALLWRMHVDANAENRERNERVALLHRRSVLRRVGHLHCGGLCSQFFYECEACRAVMRPESGDCCVFCSYGSVKCPPMQSQGCCS